MQKYKIKTGAMRSMRGSFSFDDERLFNEALVDSGGRCFDEVGRRVQSR